MIVCLCNNVSDEEITKLIEQGFSFKDIMYKTGACCGCGTCYSQVKYMIYESTNDAYSES